MSGRVGGIASVILAQVALEAVILTGAVSSSAMVVRVFVWQDCAKIGLCSPQRGSGEGGNGNGNGSRKKSKMNDRTRARTGDLMRVKHT